MKKEKKTSKYIGVSWNSKEKVWRSAIVVNKKSIFIGSFNDEVEAARAYDKTIKKYRGLFTKLNFPIESDYFVEGDVNSRKIPLSRGLFAFIDQEDFDNVIKYKWSVTRTYENATWYAIRCVEKREGKTIMQSLHKFLLCVNESKKIDHKDGNGLNNRRNNLRESTHLENLMNQKIHKYNSSGYKGVSWHKSSKKWRARINIMGKEVMIGLFTDKHLAAQVYNEWAIKNYGEFARLNIIVKE